MLPFQVEIGAGSSIYEQVVMAVKKAVLGGRLRPGEPFPSVRTLSRELKINPNTAHRVVASLVDEGLLEVRPGVGTLVADGRVEPSAAELRSLLDRDLEAVLVEARRLSLDLDDVVEVVRDRWVRLFGDGVEAEATANERDHDPDRRRPS